MDNLILQCASYPPTYHETDILQVDLTTAITTDDYTYCSPHLVYFIKKGKTVVRFGQLKGVELVTG